MALNTYTALSSAVASWLHRSDLTFIIPDFITLAERRIYRRLRVREMETIATVTSTGTATVSLPSSYLEGKRLFMNGSTKTELSYIPPEDFYARYMGSTTTSTPEAFTIEGENLVIGGTPASGLTFDFLYYKQPAALSTTNHSLFTNNPDVFLFGSLIEAQPYLKDEKRFPLWEQRFQQALQDMEAKDSKDRHSGSVLRIRTLSQVV